MKKIHHVLIFNFKSEISDNDKQDFLDQMKTLKAISGVSNFEISLQIHSNTKFTHILSMDFDSDNSYHAYVKDPLNRDFVNKYWLVMVDNYLVIDNEIAMN